MCRGLASKFQRGPNPIATFVSSGEKRIPHTCSAAYFVIFDRSRSHSLRRPSAPQRIDGVSISRTIVESCFIESLPPDRLRRGADGALEGPASNVIDLFPHGA